MNTDDNRVSKGKAVQRLLNAGYQQEANELAIWRDANGNNLGWDGWVRRAYPHVVDTIWP
ncbi:MAG: hypothetical protein NT172_18265 [Planctomycetota bacterium]|nr:hypothetical protein [Planctomycetota bacterium]